jgi:uroporphyrin-3 C-methyltransferase
MKKAAKKKNEVKAESESSQATDSRKEPVLNEYAEKDVISNKIAAKKKSDDSASASKDKKTQKKSNQADAKSTRSVVLSLTLLIAILAIGIATYDFWLWRLQQPVNTQLADSLGDVDARISDLQQALQDSKAGLSAEVKARSQLQAEQQAVNTALQSISEKLGRSTIAWRMAEVEYLLTVANHRLTLAHDKETAIAVFATADSRLKAIADPSLLGVRKKIASELAALRAVPNVDIPGLVVQLGGLVESVEQLPLIDKKRLAVASEKPTSKSELTWREIPAAVWNDVKSLVKVRRHKQPTEPLLPPRQAWFLYQNLQLKLEQARLAALQENTPLFTQSLSEVSQWLNSYFDTESSAVISMQEMLEKLRAIELKPELPDVSGSLRELRAVINDRAAVSKVDSKKVAAQ